MLEVQGVSYPFFNERTFDGPAGPARYFARYIQPADQARKGFAYRRGRRGSGCQAGASQQIRDGERCKRPGRKRACDPREKTSGREREGVQDLTFPACRKARTALRADAEGFFVCEARTKRSCHAPRRISQRSFRALREYFLHALLVDGGGSSSRRLDRPEDGD